MRRTSLRQNRAGLGVTSRPDAPAMGISSSATGDDIMSLYAGLQISETCVKLGIVSAGGALMNRAAISFSPGSPDEAASLCACLVRDHCPEAAGVGIAVTGRVDGRRGEVSAPSLGWARAPIGRLLEARFGRAPLLFNDAECALYAEWRLGVCRSIRDVLYLSVGSSVGSALLVRGKPYRGADNMGLEIGHMTTHAGGEPCPCGRNGCFERYASQTALERLAGGLEAGQVIARAQAGEPLMAAAFHRYLDELCVGLSSLIALFHPQMTVLGGALSHAGPYLLGSVRRHMQLPGMMSRGEPVPRIELSVLGSDAALIGAALMALERSPANPNP